MSIQKLADYLANAVQTAKSGGIAAQGIYSAGSVIVEGKTYRAKIIVPINVYNGQRVYVQVSAGDNMAYIIG